MKKEIEQFKKDFIRYAETHESVLVKETDDMFVFNKKVPLVNFKFDDKDVFILKADEKYLVGYIGKINAREKFETLKLCFSWLRKHLDTETKYDYFERISKPLFERIRSKDETITNLQLKIVKTTKETTIKKIIHNKGTTVVWFDDNEKVVVRKAKGEKDSVYSAVAYAITKRIYGNNSHFQSVVDKAVVKDED